MIIGEQNLIFDRLYRSIGLRFSFLFTTIDLIDVFFVSRLLVSIQSMFFGPSVPTYENKEGWREEGEAPWKEKVDGYRRIW